MDRRTFHKVFLALLAGCLAPRKGNSGGWGSRRPVRVSRTADGSDGSIKDLNAPIVAKSAKTQDLSSGPLVLRVHSAGVITGSVDRTRYLDSIDADAVNTLLEQGIKAFVGEKDVKAAWLTVLANYRKSDTIAIKPNFNFVSQGTKYTITSPQLINAVVKQLVEQVGVPPQNIIVYDLCKEIPQDLVRSKINYPIQYVERTDARSLIDKVKSRLRLGLASADTSAEIAMRERIVDDRGDRVKCYIPKVLTQADHLINMPLLTNHTFVLNSGALKNHYGTVRFSNFNSYPVVLHGAVLDNSVTDISRNHHVRNKTRLIIADGLFGVFDRGEGPGKQTWKTMHDDYPRSIFLSQDPVAIDSVMASMVARERQRRSLAVLSRDYLKDASENRLGVYEFRNTGEAFSKIRYDELSL